MAGSISPKPSFHLCPDFNISPPPDGHLQLGSVLAGLDIDSVLAPLDSGATVPVSDADLFPHDKPQEKTGFSRSLRELRSLEGSIWAKIFGWEGLGAAFSFLRSRDNDETLTVEKLLVRYFNPTPDYTKRALEVDGVAFYVNGTKRKKPVYIVTGIMCVEGAKLSKLQSRKNTATGQAALTVPHSSTTGGGNGAYQGENSLSMSFDGSSPFVLGIRVRKIWWEKGGVRREALDIVGAALEGGSGKQTDIWEGLQYVDDEEAGDASEKTVVNETTLEEEEDFVVWVLP